MKLRCAIWLLLVLAGPFGCTAGPQRRLLSRPPEPVEGIDRITILSLPAALNLDNDPGPDGLRVRVYLFQVAQPRPVAVSGTLEFLLYENKINPPDLHTKEPLKVWTFPPEKLPMHLVASLAGWSYAMELRWGVEVPQSNSISLAVRYDPPSGQSLYSAPVVIAMGQN